MAQSSITYVHPSIRSTITDNSATYITATGTTKLFATFISEKGEDNVVKMITSASEFIFNYGEPNIKLYGQTAYNVVNWLNSGGVVYCLRVLPEDAQYSNAIFNIQTKILKKKVYNSNDELVEINDVQLRPIISYTDVNNITKSSIEINELRKSNDSTIDGYSNNMIFAVIPKGRGKGYNNLGFRLSLTTAYDRTYEFRLYNFEVTQVTETGSVSVIDGPFLVSLDPDAMSISGESMFITTVIEKYCKYFQIIFNEDNYAKLGELINPYVHPNRIDFLNGKTRVLDNDEPETFYCEETGRDEDVHIFVTKYDISNNPTGERNIVDASDSIEVAIVNSDNTYRKEEYKKKLNTFENMKLGLSKIKKATGSSNPLRTLLANDIANLEASTGVEDAYSDAEAKYTVLESVVDESNYSDLNLSCKKLEEEIEAEISKLHYLFDFSRIDGDNSDTIEIETALKEIEGNMYLIDTYSIRYQSFLQNINNLILDKANIVLDNTNSEKEEFIINTVGKLTELINILKTSDVSNIHFADLIISDLEANILRLSTLYNELISEFTIDDDYNEAMINCMSLLDTVFNKTSFAIKLNLLEIVYSYLTNNKPLISNVKTLTITLIKNVLDKVDALSINVEDVETNLILYKNNLKEAQQITYKNVLQNFDSNINLLFGSDGLIENALPSSAEVEKLMIKGYKGTIDNNITDADRYPIDMILDANYTVPIKNAIITFNTEIRGDFVSILDTKFQGTPEQAIQFRKSNLSISNYLISIFTQDFIVNDAEYTGLNMQVTPTYFLSSKIPSNDNNNGIHYNFVGPRRGTISGFESISWLPNPEWKEQLYTAQLNYVEQDTLSTRFGSQLTSQTIVSALSDIQHVRALLRIRRDVEKLMKNYQFEWNDTQTRSEAQTELNNYLSQWVSNRCCDSISGSVYASDYDRKQRIMRVKIELVFNSVIEKIFIDIVVNQ